MNRREMFKAVVGVVAASGVDVKASVIDLPMTRPALIVLECDGNISAETAARIQADWRDLYADTAFAGVKAVVLSGGLRLTMLDEQGRV